MRTTCAALAIFFVLTGTCACGSVVKDSSTRDEAVAKYGTRTFDAPLDKVVEAAVGALKSQGYEIALASAEKGVVKTGRKIVQGLYAGGQHGGQAVWASRQYTLSFRMEGAACRVSASPQYFVGEQDYTAKRYWDGEGPDGEVTLWNNLFNEMATLL